MSEAAAKRYWPDGQALGRRFSFTNENAPSIEVVGVASSVHNLALEQDSTHDVYLPYRDNPALQPATRITLVVKSEGETNPGSVLGKTVTEMDRSVAVSNVRPLASYLSDSVAPRQFNLILLGAFATLAIILAAAGLYGILSYLVSRQTSEIGIRMALGAKRSDVFGLVIGRGVALAATGIGIGTCASLVLAQFMTKLLFGVPARDAVILTTVPIFLGVVAVLASYVPACRAASVDPLVALRAD